MNYHSAKMQSTRYFYLFGIPLVQEPIEISLPHLVQKLGPKILNPCLGGTNFVFFIWATPGSTRVLGHTVGPNLGVNLPHKVNAYNSVMWYTIVIQAIKHYS